MLWALYYILFPLVATFVFVYLLVRINEMMTTMMTMWYIDTSYRAHRVQDRSADLQSHEWYGTAISGTNLVGVADLPGRRALRSAVTNRLTVPAVKLSTIGSRAFSVSGPQTWNQLPEEITSATSLSTFQRHLKTFLFRKSFPDIIADWHFSGPCGNLNYLGHSKNSAWLIDWLIDTHWITKRCQHKFYDLTLANVGQL